MGEEVNIFCLDTSTEQIVMAIKIGDKEDFYVGEKGSKKHNSVLLSEIDAFLSKNEIDLSDIDVFGVAVGPGSFTGIRVAVATINAFALALNKKIVSVTTLELAANEKNVMTLLDCRHDNFYCGIFSDKVEYLALNRLELDKYDYKKIFMEGTYEKELLSKCIDKANEADFIAQARPFYVKKSSAEIETGIIC